MGRVSGEVWPWQPDVDADEWVGAWLDMAPFCRPEGTPTPDQVMARVIARRGRVRASAGQLRGVLGVVAGVQPDEHLANIWPAWCPAPQVGE